MKKVILGLVFLFGISSTIKVNATAIVEDSMICLDEAIGHTALFDEMFGIAGPAHEASVLNNFYAICMVGYDAFLEAQ